MRRLRLWLAERLLPSEFAVTLRGPSLTIVGSTAITTSGAWDGE